jgi:hypothetical protein
MRSEFTRPNRTVLSCLLVGLVLGVALDAKPGQSSSIDVSGIGLRPLADAILELEARHGWIITYEDPPYSSPSVVEEAAKVRVDGGLSKKVLAPRARFFVFDYRHLDTTKPREVLSSMLTEYNAGYDEAFRLVQQGSVFHVIPTRSSNTNGMPTERRSLLDVRVSIEPDTRSAHETLLLILRQVSLATGETVNLGTTWNLLDQSMVQGGAVNELARDALVRTVAATRMTLSWRLLCTARAPRECGFNLHTVQVLPQ